MRVWINRRRMKYFKRIEESRRGRTNLPTSRVSLGGETYLDILIKIFWHWRAETAIKRRINLEIMLQHLDDWCILTGTVRGTHTVHVRVAGSVCGCRGLSSAKDNDFGEEHTIYSYSRKSAKCMLVRMYVTTRNIQVVYTYTYTKRPCTNFIVN